MKIVLLLIVLFTFSITPIFGQQKEESNSPKIEKKEVSKKETVKLKQAKKVIKAPASKKIEAKATRKKKEFKREED